MQLFSDARDYIPYIAVGIIIAACSATGSYARLRRAIMTLPPLLILPAEVATSLYTIYGLVFLTALLTHPAGSLVGWALFVTAFVSNAATIALVVLAGGLQDASPTVTKKIVAPNATPKSTASNNATSSETRS